jgi:hypothetical protein
VTFLQHLARGIAGCYLDKTLSFICGARNSGKGVIIDQTILNYNFVMVVIDVNPIKRKIIFQKTL